MSLAKEFEEGTWECFAGASRWPDKANPVEREVGKWWVIADPHGVEAHWVDESTKPWTEHCWGLDVKFKTQDKAVAWLNRLPDDFHPETFGFEEN